jgi:glycosyltransferase involved in cell wall biosynthesis
LKVVIFAHTPPPFHGQSYMVQLMLDGLREAGKSHSTRDLQLFHVDAKLSSNLETIGKFQWSKVFLLLKYCTAAYFYRFVHRADTFYYVPAPGLRAALYRDWIVMFFCRPIFKKIIFHWHAVGLGEWLEKSAKPWERQITQRLLGRSDLSIVLSEFARADAARLSPCKIDIVPNGIPDPCPRFSESVWPKRKRRLHQRKEGKRTIFTVLFIGACTVEKGLFATLDAVAEVNQRLLLRGVALPVRLIIAGDFVSAKDRERFSERIARSDLNGARDAGKADAVVRHAGFVADTAKNDLLRECDCLCFPTLYPAEGQPVTVIEALAFGLPVIATRWRGIPELVAGSEACLVDDQEPKAIADQIKALIEADITTAGRETFLARYRLDKYLEGMERAFAPP